MKTAIVATIMAVFAWEDAWADTEIVDGVEWRFHVRNDQAYVDQIGGDEPLVISSYSDIAVPNSLGGVPVALQSDWNYIPSKIRKVAIPDGVTEIKEAAFCAAGDHHDEIDRQTHYSFGPSALESITIPDSVTRIGNYAFYGCSSLRSIDIPNNVTSLGRYAFYKCSNLDFIQIPNSVTIIGAGCFSNCKSLQFVRIGTGVEYIYGGAFYECNSLIEVSFDEPSHLKQVDKTLSAEHRLSPSPFPNRYIRSISAPSGMTSMVSMDIPIQLACMKRESVGSNLEIGSTRQRICIIRGWIMGRINGLSFVLHTIKTSQGIAAKWLHTQMMRALTCLGRCPPY